MSSKQIKKLRKLVKLVTFMPEGHKETPYMEFKAWQ